MDKFTISDLERFSGIKAHTIRMWEQRYNTLQPGRSEGNTRYYDSRQLRRLLNITSLLGSDMKISELSELSDEQLSGMIGKELTEQKQSSFSPFIFQLVSAAMNYDEAYFDKLFASCVLKFGLKDTYRDIIHPLLGRLGIMWAGNLLPPSKEHFVSNLIRQKIFSAIDALPPPTMPGEKWLLFLPEDEFHELGLLFANFLIRKSGRKVIYLGANVPVSTTTDAVKEIHPDHVYFFLVRRDSNEYLKNLFDELQRELKIARIHVSGDPSLISNVVEGRPVNYIKSVDELEKLLIGNS